MLLPLVILLGQLDAGMAEPTDSELQAAEVACQYHYQACPLWQDLKVQRREADSARLFAETTAREAERARLLAESQAAEEAADAALRKKCGRDYMRVRIGARWSRVRECAGSFDLLYRDGRAAVYEAAGGMVRVEQGRVTRILYK